MTKKIFAMFLAVLMVVSMLPTTVFAAGCPGKGSDNHTIENCEAEVVNVVAPKCGIPGYTSYKCKTCGDIFLDSYVDPTGEHVWEAAEDVAPTCGAWGSTGGMKCKVCGLVKDATPVKPLFKEDTPCEYGPWTPAAVDCLTGGKQTKTCKVCGHVVEREIEKTDAHTWGEPKLVTPATAEASGLAIVECKVCGKQKEVEVFFTHTCHKVYVPQKNATCFEDGMKAHYECRVCGALFTKASWTTPNTAAQTAALVIPASHTWGDNPATTQVVETAPTCVKPTGYCTVCKANVTVTVPHTMSWETKVYPTCTTAGFKTGECTFEGCQYVAYEPIQAYGHVAQSFTRPATCGTYAYTFTVCLRDNCNVAKLNDVNNTYIDQNDGRWYDLSLTEAAPKVGVGFALKVFQGTLGKTLYFTGKMDGYYFATSENAEDAVELYLEQVAGVENAYQIYFMSGETKVYLTVEKSGYYTNVKMVTEAPTTYWNWNAKLNVMTIELADGVYYLGTYTNSSGKAYTTISASLIKYLEAAMEAEVPTSFACEYPVLNNDTLHVVDVTIHYEGGFDANTHRTTTVESPATCLTTGLKYTYCNNHTCPVNFEETVVIEKVDHKWEAATSDDLKNAGIVEPATGLEVKPDCVNAGYRYEKCAWCGIVAKNVKAATGHKYDDRKDPSYQEGSHTTNSYYYWICENENCPTGIVKSGEKAWEGLNKTWETLADAEAAHGKLVYGGVFKPGSCTSVGLERYYCQDANCDAKVVYVKQYLPLVDENGNVIGEFVTGKHVDINMACTDPECEVENCTGVKAPTCTEEGYKVTYQCARCNAIIGNAALGHHNYIPANGHNWVANTYYEAADCDKPSTSNYTHKCSVCFEKKFDGTKFLGQDNTFDPNACVDTTYTYYLCHCGKEHIINFVGKFGHMFSAMTGETYTYEVTDENGVVTKVTEAVRVEPTCYAAGYEWQVCGDCGNVRKVTLAPVEHTNKDGVKFTDKCTDTVEDRHCVVCHKANNHDAKGQAHDCYTADENEDKILDCTLGEIPCIIGKVCHPVIDKKVPSTCTTNAHDLMICADCGAEYVDWVDDDRWNGHKPAAVDVDENGDPLYFASYIYKTYTWKAVEVVNGEHEFIEETYVAKFIEYVPATYHADGYWKGYCQECKQEVTQVIPKLKGLGFELTVENANGDKEFTLGSLVEVTVSANSLNTAIYGFDFDVDFTGNYDNMYGLTYVGYETLNDDFILTVSNPENVYNYVEIVGRAANDVNGKTQNITISEKTDLVKLYFRVRSVYASTLTFVFDDSYAVAHNMTNNTTTPVYCSYADELIVTRTFLDFNRDGAFHVTDLYLAMTLLTGEQPQGLTYDVAMDLNKDGEVTLEELSTAYNLYVGNVEFDDVFVMGMSEEEIALMGLDEVTICNNSACRAEIASNATYCPYCGNHQ